MPVPPIASSDKRPPGGRPRVALWLLPVTLWLVATLFLRGDIGKWNDDYFFLGQIDPVTGAVRSYTLDRPLHFWRPAFRWIATPIYTALFDHDRVMHVISSATHALTCLTLFAVLRRAGAGWAAAALGGMFFLVFPAGYEVPLWNISNVNAPATGLMLVATHLYLGWLSARSRLGTLATTIAMGALAFLAASLNEQPAACAPALAVLGLGAVWCGRPHARSAWHKGLARAALPVLGAGAGLLTYAVIHLNMHVVREGDHTGSLVPMHALPERAVELAGVVLRELSMRDLKTDAFSGGLLAMRDAPLLASIAALAMIAGAVLWIRRAANSAETPPELPSASRRWRLTLAAFGIAWFLACWLPIVRIVYPVVPRLFYAPTAGLSIALAVGLDGCIRGMHRTWPRRAVYAAVLAAYASMAIMMVGIQRAYQSRWRADERQASELSRLIPNPPPNAIFVPVRVVDQPVQVTSRKSAPFARRFLSPLYSDWAGGWWLQRVYSRSDVYSMRAAAPGAPPPIIPIPPSDGERDLDVSLRLRGDMMPPHMGRRIDAIARDRIVPFEIDESGRVRVFDRIIAISQDGRRRELRLPAASSAIEHQKEPVSLVTPWVE